MSSLRLVVPSKILAARQRLLPYYYYYPSKATVSARSPYSSWIGEWQLYSPLKGKLDSCSLLCGLFCTIQTRTSVSKEQMWQPHTTSPAERQPKLGAPVWTVRPTPSRGRQDSVQRARSSDQTARLALPLLFWRGSRRVSNARRRNRDLQRGFIWRFEASACHKNQMASELFWHLWR